MNKIEKLKRAMEFEIKDGTVFKSEESASEMFDKINEIIETVNSIIQEKEDEVHREWEKYMGDDM